MGAVVRDRVGRRALALALIGMLAGGLPAPAAAELDVRLAYLTQEVDHPPALSNLDDPLTDEGVQGARLGLADNNAAGRFLKHRYTLDEVSVPRDGDVVAAFEALVAQGHRFVVAHLPAAALERVLEAPSLDQVLLFNAGAPDDRFRTADCRANLLHTLPSRAMLADALAQFLVRKRWERWFLVVGPRPEDELVAAAVRRAAPRFGARIVAEKRWTGEFDLRRSAQAEVARFTQGPDYEILIVADEIGDFGEYVPYQTWDPRPVAGTQGLVPTAWGRPIEQWGAAQLQSRFVEQAGRGMTDIDYAAWAAVRSVGEAVTRTNTADFATLVAWIRGDRFELAAFKGRKLSYRPWNGQLRQPVPLLTPRALVTLSPQEGFLHPVTDLDTLGYDQPEVDCRGGT